MATISFQLNTVRPSVNPRLDDTAFRAGTFSWQHPLHFWNAGPCKIMTVENKLTETKVNDFKDKVTEYHSYDNIFLVRSC